MMKYFSILVLASALLSGCASTSGGNVGSGDNYYEDVDVSKIKDPEPKHEPKSKYGNPSSYQVFGKTYYVKDSADGFKERGQASWYGHPFHGRRTSSGEEYDMYKMTAAHKSVPIPCYMRVTNLKNGKSIIVRVNDRGPFHDGRVIDLSYVAAKKLGVYAEGTVPVEIEVITPEYDPGPRLMTAEAPANIPAQNRLSLTPPEEANSTRIIIETAPMAPPVMAPAVTPVGQGVYLQVAAFNEQPRAQQVANTLQNLANNPGSQVTTGYSNNLPVFRVRVGPFANAAAAQQYVANITRVYPDTQPFVVK